MFPIEKLADEIMEDLVGFFLKYLPCEAVEIAWKEHTILHL